MSKARRRSTIASAVAASSRVSERCAPSRAGGRDPLAADGADVLGFLLVLAAREGIDPAAALRRKWGAHLGPDATLR